MKSILFLTIAAVLSIGCGPPLYQPANAAEKPIEASVVRIAGQPLPLLDAARRQAGSTTTDRSLGKPSGLADGSGISGKAGAQGHVGLVSTGGPTGVFKEWVPYQRFRFEQEGTAIRAADMRQAADIAAYMRENPTVRLGLDGSPVTQTTTNLGERRMSAIRDALIQAGTPADRIQVGAFGEPQFRRDNQVEVLLITAQ